MEHDNRFKNALPALQNVSLSTEEKGAIRLALVEHMHTHPRRVTFFHTLRNLASLRPLWSGALVAVLLISSGAVTAGYSLPGDVLYPIKTRMNEPVVGFFKSFSPQDKVAFQWELVERRLIEAEQLAEDTLVSQKESIRGAITVQRSKAEDFARKLLEEQAGTALAAETAVATMSVDTETPVVKDASTVRAKADQQNTAKRAAQSEKTTRKAAPTPTAPSATLLPQKSAEEATLRAIPEVEVQANVAMSAAAPAATTSTSTAVFAGAATLQSSDRPKAEMEEAGKKAFKEINRIFERHHHILERLDLPLPYAEVTKPEALMSPN